jgi:large subunit ribosomal protein L19
MSNLIKRIEQIMEQEYEARLNTAPAEGEGAEAKARKTLPQFPEFGPGDTINVHLKIKEGSKERIQQFKGTVIQIRNKGTHGQTFTIRKISNGVAVERIIPFVSPNIDKIEVIMKGRVRRARLFYLRDKKGKDAKIKEKRSY